MNRRAFLHQTALTGATLPFVSFAAPVKQKAAPVDKLEVHLFSKHLQFLDYGEMAAAARDIGFDGLDLTVRPGGHVFPENVQRDLPRAVEAIHKAGLEAKMMTTAIDNVDDPQNRQVLETAAELGIQHYRTNWVRYPEEGPLPKALLDFQPQFKALARFNADLGLQGAYQNHAGPYVGSSMWEVWTLIEMADPEGLGSQYDIRHATVEGGLSWPTGLRLIHSRIKSIVLKDFIWRQNDQGRWRVQNVPLGEGMVDFKQYFSLLKEYGIQVPVSLHLEYDLGGAQAGRREIQIEPVRVFAAMRRDLETAQKLWSES